MKIITQGDRFGKLTVIKRNGRDKWRHNTYLCKCDCGTLFTVTDSNLRTIKSCGCVYHNRRRYAKNNRYETCKAKKEYYEPMVLSAIGLSREEILSLPQRKEERVRYRSIMAHLLRKEDFTYISISEVLGIHYTSIIYGVKQVEYTKANPNSNRLLYKEIKAIEDECKRIESRSSIQG